MKKGVLRNCSMGPVTLKRRLSQRRFPVSFVKLLTPFLQNTWRTASEQIRMRTKTSIVCMINFDEKVNPELSSLQKYILPSTNRWKSLCQFFRHLTFRKFSSEAKLTSQKYATSFSQLKSSFNLKQENAMRCDNRDDLLQPSSTLKISNFSEAYI